MTLVPGTRLGAYEILAPIGAGGMGEVFKARDTRLDRVVAIKILQGHLSVSPETRQRFEREARVISSLNHPNICTLFDIGHQDGMDYLVMEYLEGDSLADRLAKGPLSLQELLKAGTEVADALDRAHRQGLVHRDLKPGNIMLTKAGAKLLDFGLARATGLAPSAGSMTASPTMSRPLTAEGTIVGTFQYMAPEQLEGKEADPRSDLFSFGAVLYEMATGRHAFEGKSQASLIASILKETPQPISSVSNVSPPALDKIVMRCLEKDPEDRYQTARDVLLELKWVADAGSRAGIPAPVAAKRKSRELLAWRLVALATTAALLFGVNGIVNRPKPAKPIEFLAPVPAGIVFIDTPKISPDGSTIAFSASDTTGAQRLWIRRLESLDSTPLTNTETAGRPCWSPDGKFLAFMSDGKLKKVAVDGGPPQTVCESKSRGDASWSRKGIILYDGSPQDSIMRVNAGGGTPSPATRIDRKNGETGSAWPSFLPDGRHFLFLGLTAKPDESYLKVGDIESDKVVTLQKGNFSRIEYVAPGYIIYARERALLAQPFDAGSLKMKGDPFPIVDDVAAGGGTSSNADFSTSRSTLIFRGGAAGGLTQVFVLDRDGRDVRTIGDPMNVYNVSLSPDGQRLATSRGNANVDLWITDIARGVSSRFTFDPAQDFTPVWSPDGKRIAFNSDRSGREAIYIKDSDGVQAESLLVAHELRLGVADWSRDGRYLACLLAGKEGGVYVIDLQGDRALRPVVVTPFLEGDPRFSPDGRWILYSNDESGRREVYIQSIQAGSGKWQVSTDGGRDPRWSRDGKEIFFLASNNRLMAVDVTTDPTITLGTPHVLFRSVSWDPDRYGGNYDVSADRQHFYIRRANGMSELPATTVVVNWMERFKKR
ncbi:MAG TPA: protein kinase [Candidatus Eisenbacteria bacterium]|nr:protein kinase [Candidatus Eisenbacteria bacterium]